MYIIRYAFLNAWRNRRRTIINMSAFVLCIAMILFFVGIYRFRITDGVTKAVRYRSGHAQIHAAGYDKSSRNLPLDIAIKDPERLLSALRKNPEVFMASERIRFFTYASNGIEQFQCVAIAINPEKEKQFTLVGDSIAAGRYLVSDDAGVVITEKISKLLRLKTGDIVRLKSRSSYGTPNIIDAEVIGIVHPPFSALDQSTLFIPLQFARELLLMDESATEIIVAANDIGRIGRIAAFVQSLPESRSLEMFDWKHYETSLVTDIFIDTRFLTIFFVILILVAIFIMNNSMSMSVFERMRELGTLRAIGITKNAMVGLVSLESALIGLIGAATGCILGALICRYFAIYGLSVDVGELSSIPVSNRFYPIASYREYVGCLVLGLFAGWIGGLRPALQTRRMNIVETLHE